MIEAPVRTISGVSLEESLRATLAQGDAVAGTVQPVLNHLLAGPDASLFGEEILARMRGMLSHLGAQLLDVPGSGVRSGDPACTAAVIAALRQKSEVLSHLHALALEWQITERLLQEFAIDPITPPLLQSLLTSQEVATRELAAKFLGSQARWCQAQRRMQLPLAELPQDVLDSALAASYAALPVDSRSFAPEHQAPVIYRREASRIELAGRLLTSISNPTIDPFDVGQGGVALFMTTLALASGQARDRLCLSAHESQMVRLALALRAAGLSGDEIERQLFILVPNSVLHHGFGKITSDQAASLLAGAPHAGL
ncbi:hypothetical protein [Novosphingobium sp. M1R2S20]|uniref:DUF2336 domain-containing protein n=1 Tax=Novosphingobium rhizovicinum TaxID=3228928 RepID=A0ABV3R7A8_9SPHN